MIGSYYQCNHCGGEWAFAFPGSVYSGGASLSTVRILQKIKTMGDSGSYGELLEHLKSAHSITHRGAFAAAGKACLSASEGSGGLGADWYIPLLALSGLAGALALSCGGMYYLAVLLGASEDSRRLASLSGIPVALLGIYLWLWLPDWWKARSERRR